MKTYYFFDENKNVIFEKQFENDDAAWQSMFEPDADPRICAWNDKPELNKETGE